MNFKRRNKWLIVLVCIITFVVVGCGSEKVEVDNKLLKTEESTVAVTETEGTEISTEEAIVEEKSGIPDGIDMESTLPGEEWVQSFVSKVEEPVVVIYNDETGRKEVVQPEAEVGMGDGDICAVFHPKLNQEVESKYIDWSNRSNRQYYELYELENSTSNLYATVCVTGSENWEMSFAIKVNESQSVLMPSDDIIIPEGVDINSALTGQEWMETFVTNGVTEPVVVFFNDETGRKEVVQPYSNVTINSESDRCGIYTPEGRFLPTGRAFMDSELFGRYEISKFDFDKLEETREMLGQDVEMIMKFDRKDEVGNPDSNDVIAIPFTLIVENNN